MTKDQIKALLMSDNRAVEKGLCRIYANQTEDEQSSENTTHSNGRGFNYHHAKYGSYMARWVLSGKPLTGKHLEAARKMCLFYIRQLVEESSGRLNHNTITYNDTSLSTLDPFQR